MDNQWSLFGLDLSRSVDIVRLALYQLLWGEEAGLKQKFYPTAKLINGDAATSEPYAKFVPEIEHDQVSQVYALRVPAELALAKTIVLPIDAEVDLASALIFEVSSNSPFSEEDTCSGWRVISRNTASLQVALVITSRQTVLGLFEEHAPADLDDLRACEVWAESGDSMVQLDGFGMAPRRKVYYRRLFDFGGKLALLALAACMLAAFPAAMLGVHANQLHEVLATTEREARSAAEIRSSMVALEEKVSLAREFFADREVYDVWLNDIAGVTPDAVYLTRLGLEGDRLTISGMAMNAAEYQTTLASSGLVSDLTAPSAFTRDSRTGRERFTLTMRLQTQK